MASTVDVDRPAGGTPPGGNPLEEHVKRSPLARLQHLLHSQAVIGPAAVLLLAILVFSLMSDRFLQPSNISLILQQVAVVGTLAVGQTIIILTAGIDLSCGAVMVLTSIVMAKVATETGIPGAAALLLGFLVGTGCGLVNGLLITRLKLPPFIATLGTMSIFFGLNLWYSGSATIRGSDMPPLLTWPGQFFRVGGTNITYGSIMMVLLVAAMAFALRNTGWGRHVYATGDDAEASRLSGIRTTRVLLSVYAVAGGIYALAAWILIGRLASASPQAGQDANLDSITAVVIGGTSLFGGRGAVIGTLLGALIVGVFRNGLVLVGVDVLWQTVAVGVLVIIAVSLDQWIRKVKA